MSFKIVGSISFLLAAISFVGPGSLSSAASVNRRSPTCNSVSVGLVRRMLGGAPAKPTTQTSEGILICHYGTVDLIYFLHQTRSEFSANKTSNRGTSLPNLGTAAFKYATKGSSLTTLQVLDGSVAFAISGSSDGLKKLVSFAKAMVPLV